MEENVNIPKSNLLRFIWSNLNQETPVEEVEYKTHKRKVGEKWEEYKLAYYKWSSCWKKLMEKYPDATFKFREFERDGKVYDVMYYADTSASVHCTVTINGVERDMWLPVMDFRNQSIPNPSSKDINDTKMRCLVKCIAVGFGLGLDLFDGTFQQRNGDK